MTSLRDTLSEFVAVRRALGAKFHEPAVTLRGFVNFLEFEGAEHVTTALALRWATAPVGVQPSTWARRLCAVRQFAIWLSVTDPETEVPPHGLLAARHRRTTPHIFTEQEIEELMAVAARLPSRTGLRALTHQTLIGLLAASGLRSGEAVALDAGDVDLHDGILSVRETKFGKSRFVPLDESARVALARYAKRRDELCPDRRTSAFLVSERGVRVGLSAARRTFAALSRSIGLRAPTKGRRIGRGPRLHDLRHTFATCRLVEWYRAGLDVDRLMPALATYLGHGRVQDTYWYIQAVPELLALATEHQAAQTSGVAP